MYTGFLSLFSLLTNVKDVAAVWRHNYCSFIVLFRLLPTDRYHKRTCDVFWLRAGHMSAATHGELLDHVLIYGLALFVVCVFACVWFA